MGTRATARERRRRRSSYAAGHTESADRKWGDYQSGLPVALRSVVFPLRVIVAREDEAAGGARIGAVRGGRRGWPSLLSALCFALGGWFVGHRRVMGQRRDQVMTNTLLRSEPCPECGGEMLWTQNAWRSGVAAGAAYRCANGHVIDPALTSQCPNCGLHDTSRIDVRDGKQLYRCLRCGSDFEVPR